MKIADKIRDVAEKTKAGEIDGGEIAKYGIEAIFAGMHRPIGKPTEQWSALMKNYANNETELKRLCGQDELFNRSRWGLACLAYIAGNSTCTSETAIAGGTVRTMSVEMLKNLDADDLMPFNDAATEKSFSNAKSRGFMFESVEEE